MNCEVAIEIVALVSSKNSRQFKTLRELLVAIIKIFARLSIFLANYLVRKMSYGSSKLTIQYDVRKIA